MPKSLSKTPAPKKDRIYGSDKNKVGSASSKASAKGIELSESILATLSQKAKDYNESHPKNKVSVATLKAVMRRGMGAYSTSHRPTITGGAPNTRQAWGFARVNKFLKKKAGQQVKAAYIQDDDLLEKGGFIAPNGKKSNLTPEQYKLVRTPEFKAWFGDWENDPKNASKVVDENGEPLVVYHGTYGKEKFNIFDFNKADLGFHFGTQEQAKDRSQTKIGIKDYKQFIESFFLNIRKLFVINDAIEFEYPQSYIGDLLERNIISENEINENGLKSLTIKHSNQIIRNLLVKKYDKVGFKYDNKVESNGYSYVVCEPNQIKLADGSNKTFDMNNPDIRYADGGEVKEYKIDGKDATFEEFKKLYLRESGEFRDFDLNPKKVEYFGNNEQSLRYVNEYNYIISPFMKDGSLKDNYMKAKISETYRNVPFRTFASSFRKHIDSTFKASSKELKKGRTFNDLASYMISDGGYYINEDMYRAFAKDFNIEIPTKDSYADGGSVGQEITCVNCGWHWNTSDSDESDKYVCHKCGFDNRTFYDPEPIGLMADGGATDFGKVVSASSRFRPMETIVFDPPLVGLNGAKLISYTWSFQWDTSFSKLEGEAISKRVSDWTQADISAETGRDIVHKYTIQMPNGDLKVVSSDSVPILLGYTDRAQKSSFPNLSNAAKTLAKQKLQLSIIEAKAKEKADAIAEIVAKGIPEVRVEEGGFRGYKFIIGDSVCLGDDPNDKERLECPKDGYIKNRLKEMGIDIYKDYNTYDLKNRIERQERKIKDILNGKTTAEMGMEIPSQHDLIKMDLGLELFKPSKTIEQIAKEKDVPLDYAEEQLRKGMKTESEHSDNPIVQETIALQHLDEMIDYYEKLEYMESQNKMAKGDLLDKSMFNKYQIYKSIKPIRQANEIIERINFIESKNKMAQGGVTEFYKEYQDWYKNGVLDKMTIMVTVPNVFSKMSSEDNHVILDVFEKTDESVDGKEKLKELLELADKNEIDVYLEPIPRHNKIKDEAKKKKITREYLISYYEKFGFELMPNGFMVRKHKNNKMEKGGYYKAGGEINPDDKNVKDYFSHGSGNVGGVLVGKRHSEGGIKAVNKSTNQPLEMEGGEVVITRNAVSDDTKREFEGKMMTNREILSKINESGGGVSFADGGDIPESIYTSGKEYKYGGKMMKDHEIVSSCGCKHSMADGGKVKGKLSAELIHIENAIEYYKNDSLIKPTKEQKLNWEIFGLPDGIEKIEQKFETTIDEFYGNTKKDIENQYNEKLSSEYYDYLGSNPQIILKYNNKMAEGGITGDLHSLTDKLLAQKIEIFIKKVQPIKFYYIDEDSNSLIIGLDENYTTGMAEKLYKEATSSAEFFDADSVNMEYNQNTGQAQYSIKLKKVAKFGKGGEMAEGGITDYQTELKNHLFPKVEVEVEVEIEPEMEEMPIHEHYITADDLGLSDGMPMLAIGTIVYSSGGNDQWEVVSFSDDGVNLVNKPKSPLQSKMEDKHLTFDELMKYFKDKAISIKNISTERELEPAIALVKNKLPQKSFAVGGFIEGDEDEDAKIMQSQFGKSNFR